MAEQKKRKRGRPPKEVANEDLLSLTYTDALINWALNTPIILDGRPFTFRNHEYLIDVYCSVCERVEVYKKAAQLGFSVRAMLGSLHKAKYRYPNGVLYLFPTRGDVTDFSKSRFSRLLNENPILSSWIRDTDSANMKAIGEGFFYFRGMKTRTGLKSIPVDMIVFDEYDEHLPATDREAKTYTSPELAKERLSHSKFKDELYLSTPTLPDFGIDLVYQSTDQKQYFIKCGHCGTWTCLEEEFVKAQGEEQKVLYYSKKHDRVIRACKKCGEEIYPGDISNTEWVKKRTKEGLPSGWWISQLNSAYISPEELLKQYEIHVLRTRKPEAGRPNPQEFWNSKIGHAWVAARNRLTKEQIRKCCSDQGLLQYDTGPCVMGVDQGADLHVVIMSLRFNKPVVCHLSIEKDWSELDNYIKRFNVTCCVVDALPETRNARKFAERFSGIVFLNYYQEGKKGNYVWNEGDYTVKEDRTESMDDSHVWLSEQEVVLPRDGLDVVEIFIDQCRNVAKRLKEDEITGSRRYIYVRLGPDHFRHAFNYAVIASTRVEGGPTDLAEDINVLSSAHGSDW